MSWTTPFTAITGNTILSSDWNSSVRDNMNNSAVGLASAAGDVFYASGSSTLAKLGVGTKFQKLRSNSAGSAFEWSNQHVGSGRTLTTGTVTLPSGTFTTITFDTTEFDNGTGTSFIAPVAGSYIAVGNVSVTTNTTDCYLIIWLNQNSTTKAFYKAIRTGGLSQVIALNISGIFDMAASDNLSLNIYQDSGVNMTTNNSGNKYDCSLTMCLVAV